MKASWSGRDSRDSAILACGIAFACVLAAIFIKLALDGFIERESPFLVFFAAVLVSAWLGGWRAGLAATALAALSADFLFMSPYYSLAVDNSGQVVRIAVFLLEGSLTSVIVSKLYRARRQAEERAAEVQGYQENLKENEERSRRLADEVVEALILSEDGRLLDANETFTRMLGYEPDEVEGTDALKIVVPAEREGVAHGIRTGGTEPYESTILRKDGTTFPAEIRPGFVEYKGRQVRATSVSDITERRRNEDTLRFFSDASAILASSLDYGTTLSSVARLAVPFMSDWCAVDVVEADGSVERLAVAHQDPEKVALARELR